MALPSSGSISTTQIQTEIGDTGSITIPDANTRTLTGKSTGALTIPTDFYGKSFGGGGGGGGGTLVVTISPGSRTWDSASKTGSNTYTASVTGNTAPVTWNWTTSPGEGGGTIASGQGTSSVTLSATASTASGSSSGDIIATATQGASTGQDSSTYDYSWDGWIDPGCVLWDTWLPGIGLASFVKVGDQVQVANSVTGATELATVTKADPVRQPCVRLCTKLGVQLDCSTSAPIAVAGGGRVKSERSLGMQIPVKINDIWETDEIISITPIGFHTVVYITCENNFFLAGREIDRYMLHHNATKS